MRLRSPTRACYVGVGDGAARGRTEQEENRQHVIMLTSQCLSPTDPVGLNRHKQEHLSRMSLFLLTLVTSFSSRP